MQASRTVACSWSNGVPVSASSRSGAAATIVTSEQDIARTHARALFLCRVDAPTGSTSCHTRVVVSRDDVSSVNGCCGCTESPYTSCGAVARSATRHAHAHAAHRTPPAHLQCARCSSHAGGPPACPTCRCARPSRRSAAATARPGATAPGARGWCGPSARAGTCPRPRPTRARSCRRCPTPAGDRRTATTPPTRTARERARAHSTRARERDTYMEHARLVPGEDRLRAPVRRRRPHIHVGVEAADRHRAWSARVRREAKHGARMPQLTQHLAVGQRRLDHEAVAAARHDRVAGPLDLVRRLLRARTRM